jgi:putative molybdopterin biosynthesis protein
VSSPVTAEECCDAAAAPHVAPVHGHRRTRYLAKKSLAETLRLLVEEWTPPARQPELLAVEDSLGRVTAEPIFARRSVPHYHGAAMDGIAVRAQDTFGASETAPIELQPAPPDGTSTTPGRDRQPPRPFAYVDTGQALPSWANAVVMIENVYPAGGGGVALRAAAGPWQHVRLVGEDVVATEPLLPRSHVLRPYDIGALLAAGHLEVRVVRRPHVAIIPTGGELVEPGEAAPPGAIVEFNSRVIAAFVCEWGGVAQRLPAVADDLARIRDAVAAAAAAHDVVVVIAGSSAGERDQTVAAIGQLGDVLVHGIDIMPGKPAIGARVGSTPVLGVPGYPVSAVIVCQQVLRPLLAKLLATAAEPPQTVRAMVPRKLPSKLGLEEFVRVSLGRVGDRIVATPLARGAGVITTMVRADGLLRIPPLAEGINAGEEVDVELLRPASAIAHSIVFSGSHDLTIGILEDRLKRRAPRLKVSMTNVGSLGGLLALKRGEAHVIGTHLLDPQTGVYNLPDIRRLLGASADVVVVRLAIREQGLITAAGNAKRIRTLRDLTRADVRFVNRQPGAGTRVLLDYQLGRLRIAPRRIAGYEREEFTHMAVAVAVASGLADCGLGIRSAAVALGLDFVPIEREEYDLVMRADFAASDTGTLLLETIRSAEFRAAVEQLGGYDLREAGTIKALRAAAPARRARRAGR